MATNIIFAKGGVKCKYGTFYFHQSLYLVASELLRNRPLRVAAKPYSQW